MFNKEKGSGEPQESHSGMNELIPISEQNGKRAVNARDLHVFLESKYQFEIQSLTDVLVRL